MATTTYGRTWWGQQWLNALNNIDFTNRLPRGKSYANKGAVTSLKIIGNNIQAKVKGSNPKPYNINIVVPPFFDEEKNIFIQSIQHNPLVLSRLLNRELPNELLEIAQSKNIKIFPTSWQDIKLNCSCPDWAVPCKHLAAVVYKVANEIDQNPFLVFQLHNFDITAELAKLKIDISTHEKENIFCIDDCIALPKKKSTQKESVVEKIEAPDFSTIENMLTVLPTLFSANPLFYGADFKTILQPTYKKLAKAEAVQLLQHKQATLQLEASLRYANFTITYNEQAAAIITAQTNEGQLSIVPFSDLLILLAQTESKHLENYSASFVAMYRSFRYCNILVERGAILPKLFQCAADTFTILWVPALLNQSVQQIFNQLLLWVPNNLFFVERSNSSKNKKNKSTTTTQAVEKEQGLQLLCSLFIKRSVEQVADQIAIASAKTSTDRKVIGLFFTDAACTFDQLGEKEIPNTIQLWLKRFYITHKNFAPVLQVTELEGDAGGFEVEVLVKNNADALQKTESLYNFLQHTNNEDKLHVLKDLNTLSEYYPELNKIIATEGKKKSRYTQQTFAEVLLKILPAIKVFGIKALLPKSLQKLLRPQTSLSLSAKKTGKTFFSIDQIMNYDWRVAMGDTLLTADEFSKLAKSTNGLVKIKDQYVLMSEDDVSKVIQQLTKPNTLNAFDLLQAVLSEEYNGATISIDAALKKQIQDLLKEENVALPKQLQATLRPYQQRGFNWMYKNARLGLGSLLADDMGLGKTLQVITTLLKFKEEGILAKTPALVIAPTTLLTNWKKEIERFAPSLTASLFHGSARKLDTGKTDVILTTYGVARTDNEKLCKQKWHTIIIDEAQNIKNHTIAQTKSVKKIKANIKIAMSGTPVENRLSEYWSIFDFANPGYLGNQNWFNEEYAKPIELNQDRQRLQKFKTITAPFIMRRVKTDKAVISDLPDKIENNQYCNLTKEQAALYQNLTHDMMQAIEQAEGMDRRGLVLKLLITLKQVCNHPSQYLKNDTALPELSGKMMLLLQLLETIYENNEKVLIFSQYQEMGAILRKVIHQYFGKKALQLHGGCSRKERDEMVDAFQHTKQADTFILSIKAGGTGLNLTSAANVIHYDLWWNPAVEAQATDRAFRIGQKQNVMVHRLITKGTLEEKIDEMIKSKKQLANLTVSNGEKWIGELNDKELQKLVMLNEGS